MKEILASYIHHIWNKWMKWQFDICVKNDDGSLTIPADRVERWTRQMNTPYTLLTEEEKESDRHQAAGIMNIIKAFYDD